jgi:nucleoside 2-deoxyribosyltransferase
VKPIYLAGPFFNSAQVEHVVQLEQMFSDAKLAFFSPRMESPQDVKDPKVRKLILGNNVEGILKSSFVLACLDWLLPLGESVRVIDKPTDAPADFHCEYTQGEKILNYGPALNLPDAGTVWEIGFAYAKGIPVIGMVKDKESKVNVMLSESMDGIVRGYSKLVQLCAMLAGEEFFDRSKVFEVLELWKGEFE